MFNEEQGVNRKVNDAAKKAIESVKAFFEERCAAFQKNETWFIVHNYETHNSGPYKHIDLIQFYICNWPDSQGKTIQPHYDREKRTIIIPVHSFRGVLDTNAAYEALSHETLHALQGLKLSYEKDGGNSLYQKALKIMSLDPDEGLIYGLGYAVYFSFKKEIDAKGQELYNVLMSGQEADKTDIYKDIAYVKHVYSFIKDETPEEQKEMYAKFFGISFDKIMKRIAVAIDYAQTKYDKIIYLAKQERKEITEGALINIKRNNGHGRAIRKLIEEL